jgi:dipeptide/tripeptide permease
MSLMGLNWWSVLVAIVVNMALGFLWYGPFFGKPWMKLVGKEADDLPQNFTIYIVPVLATLLSVIMLWTIKRATGLSGVLAAISAWVGFVALTTYTNDLFEGRSVKLWLINNTYHLAGFVASGLILDLLN